MKNQTILVFGGTGMLGNYCVNILEKNNEVVVIDRDSYDIVENNSDKLFNIIESYKDAIIINCAGVIPQRDNSENNYYIINSLFPKTLSIICSELKLRLIHMSTNCVFDYKDGMCDELKIPNETTSYGISKILGEPENACVIRASIIGEELVNKRSLLEWVLSKKTEK